MSIDLVSPRTEADEARKRLGSNSIPVDVEALCKKLGIEVFSVNMNKLEAQANGLQISGLIFKEVDEEKEEESFTIYVNENEPYLRERFTIAHELGHYFLHMKDSDVIASFRSDQSPRETEANSFAAELLMPRDEVRKEHKKLLIPTCGSLAEKFQVSKQAMAITLDQLGLSYVG